MPTLEDIFANPESVGVVLAIVAAVLSIGSIVVAALMLPRVLTRLPADYLARDFTSTESAESAPMHEARGTNPMRKLAKNVVGWTLIGAGVAMLFLPGQGLLTILGGMIIADVPGKRRMLRKLLSRPGLRRAANRIREKSGAQAFEPPNQRTGAQESQGGEPDAGRQSRSGE